MKIILNALHIVLVTTVIIACGGGGSSSPPADTRPFLMGTTPFFATATAFPDWRFENINDKDLISLHGDDFLGVPWDQCDATGCTPPASWVSQWTDLATQVTNSNKVIYLSLSPLGGRKTLAPRLDASGNKIENWAPTDANGCYEFATDAGAEAYKQAYISYVKYIIDLVGPDYVSPAIEMNILFSKCPAQKDAWIAWYTDVHNALKTTYPALPVFATFQLEDMYGISGTETACAGGISLADCFEQRLAEVLMIPGDRIAFSSYPIAWTFWPDYSFSFPGDTFQRVQAATTRRIWISETGWAAVEVLQSYEHANSSCGAVLLPASSANDSSQEAYISWLLSEADAMGFEAVIWWLNRDYLDGSISSTCPCTPENSDTCILPDAFYTAGGDSGETLLRVFGNMALRNYDGSPRPAHAAWMEYYNKPLLVSP